MARSTWLGVLLIGLAGCGEPNGQQDAAPPPGQDGGEMGAAADLATPIDEDLDGLEDALELKWARDYLPFLSLSPAEKCPLGGLLVRVRPHPMGPPYVFIFYDYLYDRDCGLIGHPGDNEGFGVTIDPTTPAPAGIVAVKAISHQGTLCQRVSECGRCPGQLPCATLDRAGTPWPALWPSENKHGGYVNRASSCAVGATCLDDCVDNQTPAAPPIVNAGEPDHPLVHDLSAQGFITAANGWTSQALYDHDPWSGAKFGGAGKVSDDLVDPSFLTPACP